MNVRYRETGFVWAMCENMNMPASHCRANGLCAAVFVLGVGLMVYIPVPTYGVVLTFE